MVGKNGESRMERIPDSRTLVHAQFSQHSDYQNITENRCILRYFFTYLKTQGLLYMSHVTHYHLTDYRHISIFRSDTKVPKIVQNAENGPPIQPSHVNFFQDET